MSEELLIKYDVPVPRYTSYPPANYFKDGFTENNFIELMQLSESENPEHIAIYIHIPFCQKICFYCGCNASLMGKGNFVQPYLAALRKEMEMVFRHMDKNRLVSQIHYGGGTPNSLTAETLKEINEFIFSNFKMIDNPEIAIECNPAHLDHDYIDCLKAAGFNRFSLGIQDFNTVILKQVNRDPSRLPVKDLIDYIKESRDDISVNLDFIYGLPGQTIESFSETIREAVNLRPDRLVTFSYAHVPWIKKHQVILEKRGLPGADIKMKMFLAAHDILIEAGYISIGLDHYVLPGDELNVALENHQLHRNFQGYCTRRTTSEVYAFGVSSISQLKMGYSQNIKDLKGYIEAIGKNMLPLEKGYILSDEQMITREIITGLMCNKKISWPEIASRLNVTEDRIKKNINLEKGSLTVFVNDGLLVETPDQIEVTDKGSLFIRNIAATLDKGFSQNGNTYSKSV
ncbi:MAG: oxygen-independent coproporphyrinogen III oxidase [Paludibacter sp.]|nr:oxygen-independent coproporphyrinogen III oxidase [Paludibacter sp.]